MLLALLTISWSFVGRGLLIWGVNHLGSLCNMATVALLLSVSTQSPSPDACMYHIAPHVFDRQACVAPAAGLCLC